MKLLRRWLLYSLREEAAAEYGVLLALSGAVCAAAIGLLA